MEQFLEFAAQPFVWGLALGLLVVFFVWKSGLNRRGELKRENKRLTDEKRDLEKHLNTQLKINATGNAVLEEKMDQMRGENETLRNNIATLQSKPGRAEMRQLQIMEDAARLMRERSTGFSPAWEACLREAENHHNEGLGGFRKMMRKVVSLPGPSDEDTNYNKDDK